MVVDKPDLDRSERLVLIVDDDLDTLVIFRHHLRGDGFRTRIATSARECLRVLDIERVDLILLDFRMPDVDGLQLFRQLRQNPHTATIPVIPVTVLDDAEATTEARQLGAVDYLVKPVTGRRLLQSVRENLCARLH